MHPPPLHVPALAWPLRARPSGGVRLGSRGRCGCAKLFGLQSVSEGAVAAASKGRPQMPENIYKIVELVGTSEESVSKAIDRAIEKASHTLRHLGWFEVEQVRGHIEDGKVAHYQVTIKAGFRLED
jgi:flavin-binding protein dodecin